MHDRTHGARRRPRSLPIAVVLLAAAGCAGTAPPPARPPAPANPANLLMTGHGRRVEIVGDTLYAIGGFTRGNTDPDRDTRRTHSYELPAGPWLRRASTRGTHAFAGSAAVAGELYAISGSIERYDAAHDVWTVLDGTDRLPRTHLGAAAVGDSVHVIGGYPAERSGHHVFDVASGTVHDAPPPPGFAPGDHLHVVASVGGVLHCVGGIDGTSFEVSDAHHAYDGTTWQPRARPPVPVWAKFAACVVVGDTLYVLTAERGLRYDATADAWRDVAPLPANLAMPSAVVLDGRIHVLGGMPVDDDEPAVHVYDPTTDTWSSHR